VFGRFGAGKTAKVRLRRDGEARTVQVVKPKKAKADKIVQMPESRSEIKERLQHGEIVDIEPNPNPGTGESFVVTLAKPKRSAK